MVPFEPEEERAEWAERAQDLWEMGPDMADGGPGMVDLTTREGDLGNQWKLWGVLPGES